MRQKGIPFEALDNSFVESEDLAAAPRLCDHFHLRTLERQLNRLSARCCAPLQALGVGAYGSWLEVEYATDSVLRRRQDLAEIYPRLLRTALHSVPAEDMATFLGKRFRPPYEGAAESPYNARRQGARVRPSLDQAALKMYDKLGRLLRIEATVRAVTCFSHYRKVEKRAGTTVRRRASVHKTIYSLAALRELLAAANGR